MSSEPSDARADPEAVTAVETADASPTPTTSTTRAATSRWKITTQKWFRIIHVYASMISLIVMLFFGLTGITANHPNWTFGQGPTHESYQGTLPAGFQTGGTVDFLAVTEYVRTNFDVLGAVSDYGTSGSNGTVTFKRAGYEAGLTFDTETGSFDLSIDQQGLVAVMNDLHKGRDTTSSWSWVIDLSGGFLVFLAATGIGIQVFQRKRRRSALIAAAVATVVSVVLIIIAIG